MHAERRSTDHLANISQEIREMRSDNLNGASTLKPGKKCNVIEDHISSSYISLELQIQYIWSFLKPPCIHSDLLRCYSPQRGICTRWHLQRGVVPGNATELVAPSGEHTQNTNIDNTLGVPKFSKTKDPQNHWFPRVSPLEKTKSWMKLPPKRYPKATSCTNHSSTSVCCTHCMHITESTCSSSFPIECSLAELSWCDRLDPEITESSASVRRMQEVFCKKALIGKCARLNTVFNSL